MQAKLSKVINEFGGKVKTALIIGVSGQDGSYLSEFLLHKGYVVHGVIRRSSSFNTGRIDHLHNNPGINGKSFFLHYGDLCDSTGIMGLVSQIKPDEVYNLAAQSHVKVSFDQPFYTGSVSGLGVVGLLEAIRMINPGIKYYQASSSEMFGASPPPQDETTPFYPRSPYGVSKVFAYWMTKNYREAHGLFSTNGVLFNHESPRRGGTFVTKKVTSAVARIALGSKEKLVLGNLDAVRDWGYAPEYVVAMWKLMQLDAPEDLVIGTGVSMSVKDFVSACFERVNLDWTNHVETSPRYFRPTEVDSLIASTEKAERLINWSPQVVGRKLAHLMLDADLRETSSDLKVAIDTVDWRAFE